MRYNCMHCGLEFMEVTDLAGEEGAHEPEHGSWLFCPQCETLQIFRRNEDGAVYLAEPTVDEISAAMPQLAVYLHICRTAVEIRKATTAIWN